MLALGQALLDADFIPSRSMPAPVDPLSEPTFDMRLVSRFFENMVFLILFRPGFSFLEETEGAA